MNPSNTAHKHTFVVCAYKENPYLEQTIESLLAQTVPSQILVSTSTPNTHITDICQRFELPLHINEHPHLAGDDWNFGYSCASTPLVTLAHQDDIYEPQFCEKKLDVFAKYGNELILSFSDYYEIRPEGKTANNTLLRIKRFMNFPFRISWFNNKKLVRRRVLSFGCSICCPSVTVNRKLVGENFFDTSFINSCDYKTWVNLTNKKGRFAYLPEKLMGHRIYAESATSQNLSEDIRAREDLQILTSLWPTPIAKLINKVYVKSEKSNEA